MELQVCLLLVMLRVQSQQLPKLAMPELELRPPLLPEQPLSWLLPCWGSLPGLVVQEQVMPLLTLILLKLIQPGPVGLE